MAIYSLGMASTLGTINVPFFDVKSGANNPRLLEVGIVQSAATLSRWIFGRSGNTPTQTSAVLLQAEDPADPASLTHAAVTWSTAPTIPAQAIRRITTSASAGLGVVWHFPRGLVFASGPSFVFWNAIASSAGASLWVVVDE